MTRFTDSPFEKLMTQKPGGRQQRNTLPAPHSPACNSCPYKGYAPCVGYCIKELMTPADKKPGQ